MGENVTTCDGIRASLALLDGTFCNYYSDMHPSQCSALQHLSMQRCDFMSECAYDEDASFRYGDRHFTVSTCQTVPVRLGLTVGFFAMFLIFGFLAFLFIVVIPMRRRMRESLRIEQQALALSAPPN